MLDYRLHLHGLDYTGEGLPGRLLRDLLDAVDDGTRGAVRLRLEGRSQAGGGFAPASVHRAARFDMLGFTTGVPGVALRAPTLREALPARFEQQSLFPDLDPSRTGLSFLSESLADAVSGNAESDAYDQPLLHTFEEFRRVFAHGVTSIEMRNGRPDSPVLVITREGIRTVRRLQKQTPRPQRVRVAGTVDAIRHSDRAFTLILESGAAVRGVLTEGDPEELTRYWGKPAVISGTALFRPSGSVLRIDAALIEPGTDRDLALWSASPRPLFAARESRAPYRTQTATTGVNALIGKWPGDESDEEVFRWLEELS